MVIKMSNHEYRQHVENRPDEGSQAWMDYIGNGGSMDPSDTFDAGWDAGQERIRALEKQCAVLAAEVDRMRPVVRAAQVMARSLRRHPPESWIGTEEALERAVTAYEAAKLTDTCTCGQPRLHFNHTDGQAPNYHEFRNAAYEAAQETADG